MTLSRFEKSRFEYARALAFSVGLFLFAVYLFSYRGGFHSVDEVSTFAVTESLVKFGRLDTDQIAWTQWTTTQSEAQGFFGWDGHVYSKKGLAISLFQAPLYWLALRLPGLGLLQSVSLLNAILTAATAALIFLILQRLGFSVWGAAATALLYGLGTIAWVYAKYLFSGTLAGFLLTLTAYLLLIYKQDDALWTLPLAGFAGALTVLARANNLLLLAIFGLYLLFTLASDASRSDARASIILRALFLFGVGAALAGVIFLWYNWARSGNPFQTGYDLSIFSPNILLGLYKLLFSPLRGLFIYSPILILAVPGWFKLRKHHPAEAWLIAGLVGATVLLFSAWSSGEGLSWGSRFLVPIIPFLVIALAPIIDDLRFTICDLRLVVLIIILIIISVFIQILGVTINPWVFLGDLQAQFGGEFFLEKTAALYDFSTSQIAGQLQNWNVENSDLIWWQPAGFDGLSFGLGLGLVLLTGWLLWTMTRGQGDREIVLHPSSFILHPSKTPLLLVPLSFAFVLAVTVFLLARYYQTDARQFGPPDSGYIQALNRISENYNGVDKAISVAENDYHIPMNRFKGDVSLLGFARSVDPLRDTAYPLLEGLLSGGAERVWLITVGRRPAEAENRAEAWLAENAFKSGDEWLPDNARLLSYGVPRPAQSIEINQLLGDSIRLEQVARPQTMRAGQILPVAFTWRAISAPDDDYSVFLQLIAVDGSLVAQRDGLPQSGYRPTTQWPVEDIVSDQRGLDLPADLPSGDYRLIAGMYNPANGQRLTTLNGVDFVDLGIVEVLP